MRFRNGERGLQPRVLRDNTVFGGSTFSLFVVCITMHWAGVREFPAPLMSRVGYGLDGSWGKLEESKSRQPADICHPLVLIALEDVLHIITSKMIPVRVLCIAPKQTQLNTYIGGSLIEYQSAIRTPGPISCPCVNVVCLPNSRSHVDSLDTSGSRRSSSLACAIAPICVRLIGETCYWRVLYSTLGYMLSPTLLQPRRSQTQAS